jgi:hypothetical protein
VSMSSVFFLSLILCFSSSQHPSSSVITAPGDISHEPIATEDDCVASSNSDSDSSSSYQTTDKDSDQGNSDDTCSGNESGPAEDILHHQTTDVTKERATTDTPEEHRAPCVSNHDHGPCSDLEQTSGTSLANGMSVHIAATESRLDSL